MPSVEGVPADAVTAEHGTLDARAHHPRTPVGADHGHDARHADADAAGHRLLDGHLGHRAVGLGDPGDRLEHAHRSAAVDDSGPGAVDDVGQHVADPALLPGRAVVGGDGDAVAAASRLDHAEEAVLAGGAEHHLDVAAALAQLAGEPEERRTAVAAADEHAGDRFGGQREGLAERSDDVDGVVRHALDDPPGAGPDG